LSLQLSLLSDEGEGDGEESEEKQLQRKPWGCTKHFCPVALATKGVLWPGSQDIAARLAGLAIIVIQYGHTIDIHVHTCIVIQNTGMN